MNREYTSLMLLLLLNFSLRIPATPHEVGLDSFYIHQYAQSIIEYGHARWMLNPLSFFGLYPFSKASGVPYLVAIISSISFCDMESLIYSLSLLFSFFGVLTSYALAKEFSNDFRFKISTAFLFSTSPLAIKFTLFTIQPRGLFIMFTPLFMWAIIRTVKNKGAKKMPYILISSLFFVLLAGVHKIFVLLLPLIAALIIASALTTYVPDAWQRINPKFLAFLFPILFVLQYTYIRNFWVLWYLPFHLGQEWYHLIAALIIVLNARLGILFPLTVLGLSSILRVALRPFKENFLVLAMLFFMPVLAWGPYFYQFLLPVFSLLAGYGIVWIWKKSESIQSGLDGRYMIPLIMVFAVLFSLVTLNIRYTAEDETGAEKYMDDRVYHMGRFMREKGIEGITSTEGNEVLSWRLGATSGQAMVPTEHVVYFGQGLYGEDDLQITNTPFIPSLNGLFVFVKFPFNGTLRNREFNIDYIVRSKSDDLLPSDGSNRIYDNGLMGLWGTRGLKENPVFSYNYTLTYD